MNLYVIMLHSFAPKGSALAIHWYMVADDDHDLFKRIEEINADFTINDYINYEENKENWDDRDDEDKPANSKKERIDYLVKNMNAQWIYDDDNYDDLYYWKKKYWRKKIWKITTEEAIVLDRFNLLWLQPSRWDKDFIKQVFTK